MPDSPSGSASLLPPAPESPRTVLRPLLPVVLGYVLLTLLLTWPLVTQFTTAVPGVPGDTNVFLWNAWWVDHALTRAGTNPFHTDYIFHPQGVSLVFHSLTFLNSLVSIPLRRLFGPIAAHNLIVVAGFVLSGCGAYLLIRHLTRHEIASFIGGIVFAFCPYTFAHLRAHVNLVSTQWIPFYVLCLLRMIEGPPRTRIRYGFAAGLFLLFTAYTDYYYLYYLCIFTAAYLAYVLLTDGRRIVNRSFLKASLTGALTFLAGLAPLLVLAVRELASGDHMTVPPHTGFAAYVADVLGFVTPSVFHPVFKGYAWVISRHFRGNPEEWTVFLGYTVIVLSVVAVVRLRRRSTAVRFWMWLGLAFLFLSLGPYPRVCGVKIVPLPTYFLKRIPILQNFRVCSRFSIMTMLSCAVLTGFGLTHLLGGISRRWKRGLLAGVLLTLIVFEYLAVPFPMLDAGYPRVYDRIAADPEECVLLEVPLGWGGGLKSFGIVNMRGLYFQTVHRKKLFSGVVSRFPDSRIEYFRSLPFLSTVLELQQGQTPAIDLEEERSLAAEAVERYHIRYVVIHRGQLNTPVHRYLLEVLPLVEIHADDELVAYRVKATP